MFGIPDFWRNAMASVLILTLLLSVVAACDDDDNDETASPVPAEQLLVAAEPLATAEPSTTQLPFLDDPVKIGAITAWSGAGAPAGALATGAIKFAEWYYNEFLGGIAVGDVRRPIEIVTCDDKTQVTQSKGCAEKLLTQENVCAITMGGVANPFGYPIADVTDPASVLFATYLIPPSLFTDYEWTITTFYDWRNRMEKMADFVIEELKPQTMGFLAYNDPDARERGGIIKDLINERDPDVDWVYEEYHMLDVVDFSSFLTTMKYKNPDILVVLENEQTSANINKQIMDLGGWGDIQVVAENEAWLVKADWQTNPGLQGAYIPELYLPGKGTPAQMEFTQAWEQLCEQDSSFKRDYSFGSSTPTSSHPIFLQPIVAVIEAIKLAGTDDPAEIARAARSGNLEFDSPLGYLTISSGGFSNLSGSFYQIRDGEFVLAWE